MRMARCLVVLSLAALLLAGCPGRSTSSDASLDRADAPDATLAFDALDVTDALDADATLDADAARDVTDARDASDAPAIAQDANVSDDVPDDVPRCMPGMTQPCTCYESVPGVQRCQRAGRWGYCICQLSGRADGGVVSEPLPPRLIAPLSGSRVMSQRPTLRWTLPTGLARARVELCGDRACTRSVAQQEVTGSSWRSPAALSPGVLFWRVRALESDGSVAWTSATWSFSVRHRDTPVDTANIPLHDFDGDGFDDVAVRANGIPGEGVRVFFGASGGIRETPTVLRNPLGGDRNFGHAVAIGDFDGDGYADLAASQRGTVDESRMTPGVQGHVFVHHGASSGVSAAPHTTLTMLSDPDFSDGWWASFGVALAAVDFNGDGYDDLLVLREVVAARYYPKVFLYLGSATGLSEEGMQTLPVPADVIYGVRGAWGIGDVDLDGYGDIAFSLRGNTSDYEALQILHGNPSARLGQRIEEIDDPHLAFFAEYGSGGDFNGDGFADVFTGGGGHVVVYSGSDEGMRRLIRLSPPPLGYELLLLFGRELWIQGDLNGDGFYDVVAGGACDEEQRGMDRFCQTGRVIVYSSSVEGMPPVSTARLASPYADGLSVFPNVTSFSRAAIPGDLNADGIDDLVVGAGGSRDSLTLGSGSMHIYLGGSRTWERPAIAVWGDQMFLSMGSGVF